MIDFNRGSRFYLLTFRREPNGRSIRTVWRSGAKKLHLDIQHCQPQANTLCKVSCLNKKATLADTFEIES